MSLQSHVLTCIKRVTRQSVNGPLTTVTLAFTPDGSLSTPRGAVTFVVHDQEDLEAYQVGRRFRLTPVAL